MKGSDGSTKDSKRSSCSKKSDEEDKEVKNGTTSSNSTVEGNENKGSTSGSVRQYNRSKLPRLRWTPDLHLCFVHAVERLGGQDRATPKLVLQLMNIKGLSIAHVKSHLQMYRSKKIIDEPNQGMNNQGLGQVRDQHIYNLSQIPMLQSYKYDQRLPVNLRYGDTSWGAHASQNYSPHTGWTASGKAKHGFYGSFADRTLNRDHHRGNSSLPSFWGQSERRAQQLQEDIFRRTLTIRPSLVDLNNMMITCTTQTQERGKDHSRMSSLSNSRILDIEEKGRGIKRNALDLDLSLTLKSNKDEEDEEHPQASKVEVTDSSLLLSLGPPSHLSKLKEERDDRRKQVKRTSTSGLDLAL
ncbi:hypothetical protein Ancab_034506 [Ancistrocladus abbreviatus]